MSADPVFAVGQRVVAAGRPYPGLTEGKEYVVTKYEDRAHTPSFTWPAYVTVIGDFGLPVTGHTYRFRRLPPQPDPRIAAYVAEVSVPGIPWISTSHNTLSRLYGEHGRDVVDGLLHEHWSALSLWRAGPH